MSANIAFKYMIASCGTNILFPFNYCYINSLSSFVITVNLYFGYTLESAVANVNDSWTQYNFLSDDAWNSCHGSRFVRRRPIAAGEIGQFVGAVLCSSTRYKLFMSDDLYSVFQWVIKCRKMRRTFYMEVCRLNHSLYTQINFKSFLSLTSSLSKGKWLLVKFQEHRRHKRTWTRPLWICGSTKWRELQFR